MIKRLQQIKAGPLRLLIVVSCLLLIVCITLGINNFDNLYAIHLSTTDGSNSIEYPFGKLLPFVFLLAVPQLLYWGLLRVILWVVDGFKQA
jgi:hypothetical protein